MIVVSDNGPVAFLVSIDRVEVVPRLYGAVLVPPAVFEELRRPGTPAIVTDWISNPPSWLTLSAPSLAVDARRAGRGEREAIQLAKERRAFLLCDDRAAVNHARREGLQVTGTLGILQAAHAKGWIEIDEALDRLRSSTEFRFPAADRLEEIVRDAYALRAARLEAERSTDDPTASQ